jgi:hypothetical protein
MSIRPTRPVQPRTTRNGVLHEPPLALHDRAEADLAFVRATVERTAYFSAVPGVAGVVMGVTALAAAPLAAAQPTQQRWLIVWLAEALLAGLIGAVGIVRKARRRQVALDVGPARRFALGLAPPIIAGGALTLACVRADAWSLVPAVWLLCYGIAVLGAGAVSATRVVPALGTAFLVAGLAAVASPPSWGDAYLALAFGAAHAVAGVIIARDHGG